jgi:hypothetical protein
MAKSSINIGSVENDGTGDTLRAGAQKINDNFDEIYTTFGDGSTLSGSVTSAATATYATTAGIATVAQGLSGAPNISVGIVTSSGGFISAASTTPVTITHTGGVLTFTVAGIGSTSFTLS